MYYHPFMFDGTNGERTWATCQALVGVWLDGVTRQQQAHADAVSSFYAKRLDSLRMLSEASDTAQFAARLLSCAVPEPVDLAELSARLGGIAVDTHRKLGELVASHADEVTRSFGELGAAVGKPQRKATNGGRAAGRSQAAA